MSKQNVEIDIPDGWEYLDYRKPGVSDYFLEGGCAIEAESAYLHSRIILTKKKPLRRVFELTDETKDFASDGDFISDDLTSGIDIWMLVDGINAPHYIWKEIKEGKAENIV